MEIICVVLFSLDKLCIDDSTVRAEKDMTKYQVC